MTAALITEAEKNEVNGDAHGTTVIAEDGASRAQGLLSLHHSMPKGLNFEETNSVALDYVDDILDQWLPDGKRNGKQYVAINPTRHDGGLGSFQINTETGVWSDFATQDKGGDLVSLIQYITGCQYQTEAAVKILEFIAGMRTDDGAPVTKRAVERKAKTESKFTVIMPVPEDAREKPVHFSGGLGSPSATWEYRGADNQVMFYVNRFETADGKSYRPLSYCKDSTGWLSWQNIAPPAPRPIYGLDRLSARLDVPVIFTEGEKSADAAQRLFPELVAVTTMNGAQAPNKTDFMPFAGRKVYIAPDNDEAGMAYVGKLLELLRAVGAEIVGVMNLDLLRKGDELNAGYDLADAESDGWTAESISQIGESLWQPVVAPVKEAFETIVKEKYPGMPYGFDMREDGVYYSSTNADGVVKESWICSPIIVSALTRTGISGDWGKLLSFKDADEVEHSWALPAEMLAGSGQEYREILMSYGASISTKAFERAQLGQYIQSYKPIVRALSVSQPGWHGPNFVLGDQAFGPSAERIVLQTRSPASYEIYAKGGTFEQWKSDVAGPAAGNSRLILAICASFTGPILKLMREESGGFHYRGRSSIGKSIGLHAGASVWGGRSYIVQWNSTDNGLEATACRYNDMLLGLDEIGEMDPAKAGKVAYMLANGQGKVRADIHADAKATKKWNLMILSTGEVSLADHMATAGQTIKAGQEIRLVDIPADPGRGLGIFETTHGIASSADYANAIKESALTHYGHAGGCKRFCVNATEHISERIFEYGHQIQS